MKLIIVLFLVLLNLLSISSVKAVSLSKNIKVVINEKEKPTLQEQFKLSGDRFIVIMDSIFNFPEIKDKANLEYMTILLASGENQVMGLYNSASRNSNLKHNRIIINPNYSVNELTSIHETAHYLDDTLFQETFSPEGPKKDAATDDALKKDLKGWYSAVKNSQRYKDTVKLSNLFKDDRELETMCEYWLRPGELFARSVTQYTVIKSNDAELLKQFGPSVGRWQGQHWEAKDFKPIYEELDKLFKKNGWLRQAKLN